MSVLESRRDLRFRRRRRPAAGDYSSAAPNNPEFAVATILTLFWTGQDTRPAPSH